MLTVDGLMSTMTEREVRDFGTVSSTMSVPDRVVPILEDLTAEILGYIGSHAGNTLSSDTSLIPPEFKAKALAIARWRVLTTIPKYKDDGRKDEYDKADAFFTSVAKGIIRPRPAPDAVASEVPQGKVIASPRILARSRRYSRDQQDGI
ncbi:MAG: hypothetical protein WCJ14_08465 [Verrucomicrobiota bacterium]